MFDQGLPPPGMAQVFGYFMGSRFEILLYGRSYELLVSAGNRALEEVLAVEEALSHTLPSSTLSWINARAADEPVRLAPPLFRLLERARQLSQETEGAFDITVGALLHAWGFFRGQGRLPSEEEVAEALARTGWEHVHLDPEESTIRFDVQGLSLHLGALGKGLALDLAAGILREYGVTSALLHGGHSSIVALGAPPGESGWRIGLPDPRDETRRLGVIVLRDAALSVSGAQQQFFEVEGKRYGHLIDPRTGWPAEALQLAAAIAPSGEESEALSTAFTVLGVEGARRCVAGRPDLGAVVVPEADQPVVPIVLRPPLVEPGANAPMGAFATRVPGAPQETADEKRPTSWDWEEEDHEQ